MSEEVTNTEPNSGETISGNTDLEELLSKIHDLPEKLRQEALEIIQANAELIAGYAQIFVPVKTGKLRDSITVTSKVDGAVVTAGNAKAPYAEYVEAKTPFFAPAVQLVMPQLIQQLTDKLQETVNNESSK
jgi:HK97 gp10 family phage protein